MARYLAPYPPGRRPTEDEVTPQRTSSRVYDEALRPCNSPRVFTRGPPLMLITVSAMLKPLHLALFWRWSVHSSVLIGICALLCIETLAYAQYYSETRVENGQERVQADARSHHRDLRDSFGQQSDVAEELSRLPELRVRRTGASNAPAYISIRGSEHNAVAIHLEGIPLNGGHQSTVSLNMILPELLRGADVYRSNAPLNLHSDLPGGAINLRLADAQTPEFAASAGGGSFGSVKLGIMGTHRGETTRTLIALAYRRSTGDFQFYDNNGTDFNLNDDEPRQKRINNDNQEGSLLLHHTQRVGQWNLALLGMTDLREEGVPGLDTMQAEHARAERYTQILGFNAGRHGLHDGKLDLALRSSIRSQRDIYQDRHGEVGLGSQDRSTGQLTWNLSAHLSWWLPHQHNVELHIDLQGESYQPRDHISSLHLRRASRIHPKIGVGWSWSTDDELLALSASVRSVHWLETTRGQSTAALHIGNHYEQQFYGQAGAVLTPLQSTTETLRIFTYASHKGRAPDFNERFGDNGTSAGNASLKPERQWQYEAGIAHEHRNQSLRIHTQLTGYTQWRRNAIEYFSTPLGVRIPQNLEGARVSGIEASTALDSEYAGGNLAMTRMWTKNTEDNKLYHGNQLPWRSEWSVDGTIYARYKGAKIEWTSAWDSQFFADKRNQSVYPERWLHDLVFSYRPEPYPNIELSVELRNITNERMRHTEVRNGGKYVSVPRAVADYRGFPLPGRAIYATLTWRGPVGAQKNTL